MLSLFSGTPGSGKSYHATEWIDFYLKRGRNVICTYPFKCNNKHFGEFQYINIFDLSVDFLINYALQHHNFTADPNKFQTLIIIDEAHIKFNTRGFDLKERVKWLEFLSVHRHYYYDILLITQNDRSRDRQVRGLIEVEYKHRNLKCFGGKGKFLMILLRKKFVAVRYWYPLQEKIDARFFNINKRVARCYDTMAMFNASEPKQLQQKTILSPAEFNAQRKKEGEQGA